MDVEPVAFRVFRYSLASVEKAIAAGCVPLFEDAIPTQYDRFFAMAGAYGVLDGFEQLSDARKDPGVPLPAVCVLMVIRFLRKLRSFRQMGQLLLRYRPLLERLGFSVEVCEKGVYCCKRTRGRDDREAMKVFDEEVFSQALRGLVREELNRLLAALVKGVCQRHRGLLSDRLFIMDSNSYRVVGVDEGQKWCALMLRTRYGMIPVAIEFCATEGEGTGETSIGRRVLERALRTYGAEFIRYLLVDGGYIDGDTLRWLKAEHGIDWVIRIKEDMRGSRYMAGEALEARRWRWRSVKPPQLGCAKALLPEREVLWVEDVPGIAGQTGKLNGCLIRDIYPVSEKHPRGKVEEQYVVASNPVWRGTEIHDLWRKRWDIENAFGFMTDNWGLGSWQIRHLAVYQATIQLMVLTYVLHVLLQMGESKPQTLEQLKQRFEWQNHNMVLIRAGEACAILTPVTLNNWMVRGILRLRAP
jgi:hypothetical protein